MLEVVLFDHNQSAYDAAVDMMKQTGKAAIIHPTGTGKSFIGFRLCADHPEANILWLSPSEYIFKTQRENLKAATGGEVPDNITFCTYAKLMWMDEAQMKEICMDDSVRCASEQHPQDRSDQSDRSESAESAKSREIVQNVNNRENVQYADDRENAPAYIILDEFHRCGAQQWGQGVQKLLSTFPDTPILGLSATNIRYLDNQRDMADELFDGNIASEMTLGEAIVRGILNPPKYVLSVYACQQSRETLSAPLRSALDDRPLDDQRSRVGSAAGRAAHAENTSCLSGTLEKYEQRVKTAKNKIVRDTCEQYLEDLKRALEMSEGLDEIFDKHMPDRTGKYIVFCSNKEHMDEMMGHLEWFEKVDPHPHVYSLYTLDPGSDQAFDDFRADDDTSHLRLLYCIDALNEGIHVEGISGVILLRPTVSPIVYKQQIGRALSASKRNDATVFDIVQNVSCLESWSLIEDEMQLVTSYYRDRGEDSHIVNEHFRIIDEVRDCRELFHKLDDTLSASWDLMFDLAKAYYKEHGNLDMRSTYVTEDGYPLGQWVFTQRGIRKGTGHGTLTEEQIRKLDSIGMVWESSLDQLWEKNYSAAKAYYEEHGDLDVKWDYVTEDGIHLGEWLSSIRSFEKAGARQKYLSEDRIRQLNEIGMIWGKIDYFWERNYEAAAAYYREHGNLDVLSTYVNADGIRLGSWVHRMRKERRKYDKYRSGGTTLTENHAGENPPTKDHPLGTPPSKDYPGETPLTKDYPGETPLTKDHSEETTPPKDHAGETTLTEEQIRRLDEIGMVWTKANDSKWDKSYQAAKEYASAHGNLRVPARYVTEDGFQLGRWICSQRQAYLNQKLSGKRKEKLDAIGMVWQTDTWESRLELVKKWYRENGTVAITQNTVVDGVWIGKWLASQKKMLEEGKLSQRQVELLSELPSDGLVKASAHWIEMYQDAKDYSENHGNLEGVPKDFRGKRGTNLYTWVLNQRRTRRAGKMNKEKIQLLDEIGFDWDPREERRAGVG
ncbi:MAG: Helicase associated domain protein [Lachnospiraceae bacterium]|nr:Helicase associated domain protein [Lachnospiraceae bacterium]